MWCVKHNKGWCAIKDNKPWDEAAFNVPTLCGQFVILPLDQRNGQPTCPDCWAKLKGEAPNKKACLFQNGLRDLAECGEVLEQQPSLCWLHGDELRCAIKLIQMCRDIAEQFEGVNLEREWAEKKPIPHGAGAGAHSGRGGPKAHD